MQPCQGIAWWAHRDDDRQRGNQFLALLSNPIGSKDPDALKIPARRAEYSLTESASSPVQAEPRQHTLSRFEYQFVILQVNDHDFELFEKINAQHAVYFLPEAP
jgi:hypothetical protein